MNYFHRRKLFSAAARWLCALLAALTLPATAPAQPAPPTQPQRWLLIFDQSSAMKKRLPATDEVLKSFFATGAEGRLQDGDSIGVWTYDQKLHAAQFPLITWNPRQATEIRTNLEAFLRSQRFAGESSLAVLQPALGSVIANSERLTILIFCDGESEISSTPYDSGINQNFRDGREERKKHRQPFVVLIRTLSGKYIGCTVNFPPGVINIPLFLAPPPPTNSPPPPPPVHVVAPIKPAPVVVPDLVIVGTNVGTSATMPPQPPPAVKPAPSETPKITAVVTNPAPVPAPAPMPKPATNLAATNFIQPAVIATPANVVAKPEVSIHSNLVSAVISPPVTNHAAPPPPVAKVETPVAIPATNLATAATNDDAGRQTRLLVFVGVGLLVAAIVLVVFLLVRPGRRPQGSLITHSMQDDPRRK